jgi:hypothetical protein
MGRRTEPVKNTCPDIDGIINTITSIIKQMESCGEEDSVEFLLENISDWKGDLGDIACGRWCILEELRNANAKLREWGQEMYDEAERLEKERDEFESLYEQEKERVSELEIEIEDLNYELMEDKDLI